MVLLWCEEKVLAVEFWFYQAEPDKLMLALAGAGQPITAGTLIVMESLWASSSGHIPK